MIDVHFDDSVQVLTEDQCLALLSSHDIGRIAFGFEGRIEIFPVNYGIEGVVIVIRTSRGTKLEGAPKSAVAFEIDGWDAESGIGWSVVARGFAGEVTTDSGRVAEHLRLDATFVSKWIPFILYGVPITLFVSFASIALAIVLAAVGALCRLSAMPCR